MTAPGPAESPARPSTGTTRVAVVGGGVSGLVSAYYLAKTGREVDLYEAADALGGLASTFSYEGRDFDRFYHVMLPSDGHLLDLLSELGLAEDVYWRETSLGFVYGRETYDLATPLDLLRFKPVPFVDRVRLGLTALYAAHVAKPASLDDTLLVDWLKRLSGRRAFEKLWRPLLIAKFGAAHERIPALWYHASFNREKGTKEEVKGYIAGGYRRIILSLLECIEQQGVRVHVGTPVEDVGLDGAGRPVLTIAGDPTPFDSVLLSVPFPLVSRLLNGPRLQPYVDRLVSDLDYQGVVNVLVMLRRRAAGHYWLPVVESGVPFRGIVETTHVVSLDDTGGRHLVYLLNYVHRSDPLFERDPEELKREYVDALLGLAPELNDRDVIASFCFKRPYVEPIWTPGFLGRRPPTELVPGRLFLATTAQVYPRVTSWNSSIGVACEAVAALVGSSDV